MKPMSLSRLLAGALLAAGAGSSLHAIPASIANDYQLVWADEFEGSALDPDTWTHLVGPRANRDGLYRENAVTVANGSAIITTYTESGEHYSGFIETKDRFSQAFGYYEARIQFNDVPGMWSAFWLMPRDLPTALPPELLGNPDFAGVEVDIVEHRKVKQNGTDIENVINNALHWNGYNANHLRSTQESAHPALSNGTWHTYGVLWTPQGFTFYFNDQPIFQTSEAVSHRSSHVILSSEILGNSWAGNIPSGGFGSRAASTVRMHTDWVRVYELKPSVSGQSASASHPFPGRIEAEDFDNGGRNVAFYEMVGSGSNGGANVVDIVNNGSSSGGQHVANMTKPEWLEHTVVAQNPDLGYYYADLTLSTTDTAYGEMQFSIDGVALGNVKVQNTGGWRTLSMLTLVKVDAPASFVAKTEFLKLGMETSFDAIDFVRLGNVARLREAETATLSAGALAAATPHASAGSTVDLNVNGASVRWTGVEGFNGGSATLTLRYCANGAATNVRTCGLYVNNTLVGTVSLPGTSSNGFVNIQQAVTLNSGATNTIELRNTGTTGRLLNIDYIVTSKEQAGATVTPGPEAFPVVRPALNRLADGETAVTLVDDDFSDATTTGWSVSHERLLGTATGATISNVAGSGIDGRALNLASTSNNRSALRAFTPVTLAVGDALTVTFDYRLPDGEWSNANGLWAGFADSSQTILRDLAQSNTSGNQTLPAFYATANPAGQSGGSYIKRNQGNGATATNVSAVYGTAASGTSARSATVTFTRTGASTLEIVSDLGRFGMTPATTTATTTTSWFTFDRFFVVKGSASANHDLYIDNVEVVHFAGQ